MQPRYGILLLLVLLLLVLAIAVRAETTQPATTQLANEPLVGGALRYAPPAGWELFGEKSDKFARYRLSEETGLIEIAVDAMPGAVNGSLSQQMAMQMGKTIREQAKSIEAQLLYGPRAEKDERYWLRLHDRMKLKDGRTMDRIQIFRVFGTYVARVTATGFTDSEDEAKKIQAAGEDLLDHMRVTRGAHPTYYPRTQIKIVPPVDWKEQKTDQANGLAATYTDPAKPAARIIVRSRVLPKDARTDTAKRDALLERMIDDERGTRPFTRENVSEDEKTDSDDKNLKRITCSIVADGKRLLVQTRYFVVADVIASVRSIAEEPDAPAVNDLADKLQITPLRD